ncbi:hypothetical protein ACAS46_000904 [Vibrio vulnificus]
MTTITQTKRNEFIQAIKGEFSVIIKGDFEMGLIGDDWSASIYSYEGDHRDVTFTQWEDKQHTIGSTYRFYTGNKKVSLAILREMKRAQDELGELPF